MVTLPRTGTRCQKPYFLTVKKANAFFSQPTKFVHHESFCIDLCLMSGLFACVIGHLRAYACENIFFKGVLFMRNHSKFLGIIAMVAVMGLSLTGCQSTASNRVIGWSDHTFIPSKDYVVVGAVSLRDTNERTVIADLMDAAIEMGGHDIINVRMTETTTNIFGMRTGHQVMAATAVVIRFTDDTLIETDSQTVAVISEGSVAQTTTTETTRYITYDGRGGGGGGFFGGGAGGGAGPNRGFIGRILSRIPLLGRLF